MWLVVFMCTMFGAVLMYNIDMRVKDDVFIDTRRLIASRKVRQRQRLSFYAPCKWLFHVGHVGRVSREDDCVCL